MLVSCRSKQNKKKVSYKFVSRDYFFLGLFIVPDFLSLFIVGMAKWKKIMMVIGRLKI